MTGSVFPYSFRPAGRSFLLLAALLVAGSRPAASQQPTLPPVAAPARADTVAADTGGISARGAFLRSLVLPGWGQSYVGSPGRGAVYFAMEAGSLWWAYKTGRGLRDARRLQRFLRESGELGETETLGLVESRQEQMEDRLFQSFFILLFSAADAYVAAQLADFDQHIGVRPLPGGGMQLEAHIPLGGTR